MSPSKKTRKPACDLTEEDMRAFPIWEYAIDEEGVEEQDESWVRPVSAKKVPAKAYSQLVSATFTTPSGEQFSGYMVVSPAASSARELDHAGGALHHRGKQCFLMDLNGPGLDFMKRASLKALESSLKKKPSDIFPLTFELLVSIDGERATRKGVFDRPKKA